MTRRIAASIIVAVLSSFPVLCTGESPDLGNAGRPLPTKIENEEGVAEGNLYLDGRVYVAGQPNEEALAELARRGLAVVVNTRTPAEVENREKVPFDEERVVRDLGMDYVSIPLGGHEHPYEPAAVHRLSEILAEKDGRVLIHCGFGGRAAYLWLAFLVEHSGFTLQQAMARGEAMMLRSHPMARLTGRPIRMEFEPQAPLPEAGPQGVPTRDE